MFSSVVIFCEGSTRRLTLHLDVELVSVVLDWRQTSLDLIQPTFSLEGRHRVASAEGMLKRDGKKSFGNLYFFY